MRSRKGFTLIELLIVILILGALAAIAIPRITQSTDQAKENSCATNIDLMNSQAELWAANHDGTYPSLTDLTTPANGYFPDGLPVCELGGDYTMDATTHRVSCDH
jgi:prepilin-type N-terminal cleavage/methylation domain-containing protein